MIARLAVRLERAGLFSFQTIDDLICNRLDYGKFFHARMNGYGIFVCGSWICSGLQLVEAMIYLFDTRKNRRKFPSRLLGIKQLCYTIG